MPNAIIVEDEPLLRAELRDHLAAQWPELQIVAEAENGVSALRLIEQHQPEIIFLDIQMPGMTGLDLASHIPEQTHIVFVTAYAEHAIQAFEAGAADYLMKPIDASRIATTIRRLKMRSKAQTESVADEDEIDHGEEKNTEKRHPNSQVLQSLQAPAPAQYLKWIKASVADTVRLIMVEDVLYFQATEKYTRVVTKNSDAYIRLTLKNLSEQLDPQQFAQIHRSSIVNLTAIDRIEKIDGALYVYLRNRNEKLAVSESYAKIFKQM